MKKYDLIDTVSRGSNVRKEINPQLIVETDGNHDPGQIFDANATIKLVQDGISSFIGDAPDTLDTLEEIATKIQELDNIGFSDVALSGDYNDLTNKPTIPTVPTNVSSFTNDAGYLTSHQDISGKQDVIDVTHKLSADLIEDGTTNKVINIKPDWNAASGSSAEILNKPVIPTIPTNLSDFVDDLGSSPIHTHNQYLTSHQDISNYIQKSQTSGLIKNDGTIDTNTYAPSSSLPTTMGASGSGHKGGLVPDTGSTQGATKYLREDATWVVQATSADVAALETDTVPPVPQKEEVVVLFREYTDLSTSGPGVGVSVNVTVDGTTSTYFSGQTGTVSFNVALGKQYTIEVTPPTGYYVTGNKATFISTASTARREFTIRLMPYKIGIFIVDSSGHDWTFDDWKGEVTAGRKNNSEAELIKVASAVLCESGGVFGISIDDMRKRNYENRAWGDQVLVSPPGTNTYLYNGLLCTEITLDTATTNNINVPALALVYSKRVTAGSVELQGFLGGKGQWEELWNIRTEIDEILEYTRPEGTYLLSTYTANKWTSTANGGQAWALDNNTYTSIDKSNLNQRKVTPCYAY